MSTKPATKQSTRKKRGKKRVVTPILTSTIPDKEPDPERPLWGYARVSTNDQSLQRQVDELVKYGVAAVDIFSDKKSGKTFADRTGWHDLFRELEAGDTVVIHSLDRLGRNLEEVIRIERELREKEVTLKVLAQDINTSTAAGGLIFHVLMTVSQFEREWSLERTMHGLRAAAARGVKGGSVKTYTDEQIEQAVIDAGGPDAPNAWLNAAKAVGCTKVTVMRRYAAIEKTRKET